MVESRATSSDMKFGQMVLGLAPWFLFSILVSRLGDNEVAIAASLSALAAVVIALYQRGSGVKLLDAAGVVTFVVIAAVGFVGGDDIDEWLTNFSRGGTTFVLGAVMLVSAFTVPFTEQYARESVDREFWDSPSFHATNRRISLAWGLALLVMAVSHVVAGVLDPISEAEANGARTVDLVCNWVIPIVLIVAAVKFTQKTAADARAAGEARSAQRADP